MYQVFDLRLENYTLTGMINKINSFTDIGAGGVLGIFILIVVFAPLFLMMKGFGNERALGVAGLITGTIGIFLRIFGLINDAILYMCIIISIGGIILLLKEAANFEI